MALPAMHVLMRKWAPPEDRSWMLSVAVAGAFFGTIITYPVTAFLCEQGFDNGWASAFYIFGMIAQNSQTKLLKPSLQDILSNSQVLVIELITF